MDFLAETIDPPKYTITPARVARDTGAVALLSALAGALVGTAFNRPATGAVIGSAVGVASVFYFIEDSKHVFGERKDERA